MNRGGMEEQQHDNVPINLRKRSSEELEAALTMASTTGTFYLQRMRDLDVDPGSARVLELGPGSDFGPALMMAGVGARVAVADPYLAAWDPDYHPEFYARLNQLHPSPVLQCVLAAGGYPPEVLGMHREPAEDLASIPTASCDLVISNAVLEHVYDFGAVARELARVTAPGGHNSHQIDFRDHDDFERPLEFLLIPDGEFAELFKRRFGETGNRWRPSEAARMFEAAGFAVKQIYPTERTNPQYRREFVPRLRRSTSRYAAWPEPDLEVVAALFRLDRSLGC